MPAELADRLTEIHRQASALEASRARLAEAQDDERRRIERNIHDGAQQELAALLTKLRLARNQLRTDPARVDATLAELQEDTRLALGGLRELAQGIHPSVLTDQGLVEAVESRLIRLPLEIDLAVGPDVRHVRFADAVEGAAYFMISEALANVIKHSGAAAARIAIETDGAHLVVTVSDTGRGFDIGHLHGTGLDRLGDRISAVGGRLSIDSEPGTGTTVRATLPARTRTLTGARDRWADG